MLFKKSLCLAILSIAFYTTRIMAFRAQRAFSRFAGSRITRSFPAVVQQFQSKQSAMSCNPFYRSTSLFSSQVPEPNVTPASSITSDPGQSSSNPPVKSPELEVLEIRVGTIVEIAKHPEADSLYVEKVDVGEASGPRTIVSGLVNFCSAESLLHRKVVVLCNLKPRPLKGIPSHGMLLCASNADKSKVEPLTPASSCPNGELVQFAGHSISPAEPGNKATKAFSKIADDFFVDEEMRATFRNIPFQTSAGPIIANLKGKIS